MRELTVTAAHSKAREALTAEDSIRNREAASSILAAGPLDLHVVTNSFVLRGAVGTNEFVTSCGELMAKILPIITKTQRERNIAWRKHALVRKLTMIRRTRRGSIAQTAERRSHKPDAGGSTPPRAI